MTAIAICTDCGWTYRDDDDIAVTDALERHARKEHHHVELRRRRVTAP